MIVAGIKKAIKSKTFKTFFPILKMPWGYKRSKSNNEGYVLNKKIIEK